MNTPSPSARPATLTVHELVAMFSAALLVRVAVVAWHGFDGAYGQDAWAYFERALRVRANGFALQPLDSAYPLPVGYPYLVALAMAIFGPSIAAAQSVSMMCGAALAPIAAACTRAYFPKARREAAWVAAGLVVCSGQHITWSVAAMTDTPAAMFFGLAMLAMIRAADRSYHARWMVAAGASLGLCWTIRWSYVAAAPAFALGWVMLTRYMNDNQLSRPRGQAIATRFGLWPQASFAVIAGVIACLPQLIVTLRHPVGIRLGWSMDWRPHNIALQSFYFAEGSYDYALPMGVYYALPTVHPGWLSPVFGILAGLALWLAWQRRRQFGPGLALIMLGGSAICSWLMLSGMPHQNFRYGMQIWQPLVPLAAVGATSCMTMAGAWSNQRRAVAAITIATSIAALLVWSARSPAQLVAIGHSHRDAAIALTRGLPSDARIWALGPTAALRNRSDFDVQEIFRRTPSEATSALMSRRPLFTLFDPAAVARWRHGDLPATLKTLNEHAITVELGRRGPWTLRRLTPKALGVAP